MSRDGGRARAPQLGHRSSCGIDAVQERTCGVSRDGRRARALQPGHRSSCGIDAVQERTCGVSRDGGRARALQQTRKSAALQPTNPHRSITSQGKRKAAIVGMHPALPAHIDPHAASIGQAATALAFNHLSPTAAPRPDAPAETPRTRARAAVAAGVPASPR
ncbi:hypothetical protein FFY45_18565 [Xanthomonas hortorum]|nr:hypothetical protein [Xanthomonas hortorum]